jgi:hypothetical protein
MFSGIEFSMYSLGEFHDVQLFLRKQVHGNPILVLFVSTWYNSIRFKGQSYKVSKTNNYRQNKQLIPLQNTILHFVFNKYKEQINELSLKKCLKNTYYSISGNCRKRNVAKDHLGKLLRFLKRNSACSI